MLIILTQKKEEQTYIYSFPNFFEFIISLVGIYIFASLTLDDLIPPKIGNLQHRSLYTCKIAILISLNV